MNERYSRLFELQKNLYYEGSPVIIEAGALLKDNQKNRILAQLKILSIVDKIIVAVKVKITGIDAFNNTVENKEFHYLDLNISRNQEFGQQTPIVLNSENIRSFSVELVEVIYSDNSKWENIGNVFNAMPELKNLNDFLKDDGLVEQYNIDNGEGCNIVPAEFDGIWICTCGCFNYLSDNTCFSCNRNKFKIINSLNIDRLKDKYKNTVKSKKYKQAIKLLNEETFESVKQSKEIFESLADYNDSETKAKECESLIQNIKENKTKRKKVFL